MKLKPILFALLILPVLLAHPPAAFAHGHIQAGDYELVIGFRVEPAFQGEPNGLDLVVTRLASGERVTGLEQTLQAEIIYGESRRELSLRPRFGQEGAYTADILPTAAGDYTWRIFGEIEGFPVDVSMTSAPDTFNPVQPKEAVSFPGQEPAAADLRSLAQTALIAAVLGALLGAAGLAASLVALRAARRS